MAFHSAIMSQAREEYREKVAAFHRQEEIKQELLKSSSPSLAESDRRLRALSGDMTRACMAGRIGEIDIIRQKAESLQISISKQLAEMGENPMLFRTHYYCPKCKDDGYTSKGACDCLLKIYRRRLLEHYRRYIGDASFGSFNYELYPDVIVACYQTSPRQAIDFAFDQCLDFARSIKPGVKQGLFLHGDCGVGKSFLAASVAKEVIERGYFAHYVSAVELFSLFEKDRFGRISEREEGDWKALKDADLLIIDDLGLEYQVAQNTPNLLRLLEERMLEKRSNMIVSSLTGEQLSKRYSPQLESRIIGEMMSVVIIGEDIRKMADRDKYRSSLPI